MLVLSRYRLVTCIFLASACVPDEPQVGHDSVSGTGGDDSATGTTDTGTTSATTDASADEGETAPEDGRDDGAHGNDGSAEPGCGDGVRGFGEHCDDGNREDGDGCSKWCLAEVVELTAGWNHTCAVLTDGRAKCWGANDRGQLDLGDTEARGDNADEMGPKLAYLEFGSDVKVVQIAAGVEHTCALLDDGELKCWGWNGSGQLGLGDTDARSDQQGERPVDLPALGFRAGLGRSIHAGDRRTCVLLDGGAVRCWGLTSTSHLAVGDAPDEMETSLLTAGINVGNSSVLQLDLTHTHACVVTSGAQVRCWGANNSAQLGIGSTHQSPFDEPLPATDVVNTPVQVTVGWRHSCARFDDNRVQCWGDNQFGQLGLGLDPDIDIGDQPNEMGGLLPSVSVGTGIITQLDTGNLHNCVLFEDRRIKCWGGNHFGQLGLEDSEMRGDAPGEMGTNLPPIELGQPVRRLALGGRHTCAILEDSSVKCWGDNTAGQLGLGDNENRGDGPSEMGDDLPLVRVH